MDTTHDAFALAIDWVMTYKDVPETVRTILRKRLLTPVMPCVPDEPHCVGPGSTHEDPNGSIRCDLCGCLVHQLRQQVAPQTTWQVRAEQAERELHKIQKMAKSLTIEDAIASFGEVTDTLSWFKAIAAARLAQAKAEAEIRQLRHDCGELADRVVQHAKVLAEKNALAYDNTCLHEDIAARSDRLRALVVEARRKAPTFGVQEWEWLLGQLQGLVEK